MSEVGGRLRSSFGCGRRWGRRSRAPRGGRSRWRSRCAHAELAPGAPRRQRAAESKHAIVSGACPAWRRQSRAHSLHSGPRPAPRPRAHMVVRCLLIFALHLIASSRGRPRYGADLVRKLESAGAGLVGVLKNADAVELAKRMSAKSSRTLLRFAGVADDERGPEPSSGSESAADGPSRTVAFHHGRGACAAACRRRRAGAACRCTSRFSDG